MNVAGFDVPVALRERGGHRLAHVDTGGDGPPVVLVHGQPTWSFLWRTVIPPLVAAGFRCVAPDHLGFGRSDKPGDPAAYTYAVHSANLVALLDDLDLRDACMVVHDWGGPVGLRAAVERPDRVSRLVVMDTGLATGRQRMSDAWFAFRDYVRAADRLPIGQLVAAGTARGLSEETIAAYDAPFDGGASQAGAKAFPELIPLAPDAPEAGDHARVLEALAADERPLLCLWAENDLVLPPSTGRRFMERIGGPEPEIVPGAGHFLQEDAGEWIGERIAGWLRES